MQWKPEISHTYICECSSFADINFIGKIQESLGQAGNSKWKNASVIADFKPPVCQSHKKNYSPSSCSPHFSLSQKTIEKKHVLVMWTGWTRLVIYIGRKELEIAISSKNSPVPWLWTSHYTTAHLCVYIFGLCFHLLRTLWNAVYLGLQLQATCAAHLLTCPAFPSQSYRLCKKEN